ncbi:MAG: S9 family peptidase [Candidatus Latescibacteria bacterium]|nr:S9 family peptidase [Candidatus Latescibacterota bacterium]
MSHRPIVPQDLFRLRFVSDPQMSPDGRMIAFVVKAANEEKNKYYSHLWVVPADGEDVRPFTTGEQQDSSPRWSPDGRQIVFISDRKKPGLQLFRIRLDGGEAQPLTALDEGTISDPVWSPDGSRVVFVYRPAPEGFRKNDEEERKESGKSTPPRLITRLRHREEGVGYFGPERTHLWVVTVADGTATPITSGSYDDRAPCWSPDGQLIAFVSNRSEDADRRPNAEDIYLVSAHGGHVRKLHAPQGPKASLAWSPDGRLIAYIGHDRPDEVWGVSNAHVWVAPVAGGDAADLTADLDRPVGDTILSDTVAFGGGWPGPVWTDDSQSLSFIVSDQGSVHLYTASLDGGATTPRTAGPIEVAAVTGDRTGRRLALLIGNATEPVEVHTLSLDGQPAAPVRLTDLHRAFLDEVHVAAPEEVWFTADDGVRVQGWLLVPPEFDPARSYPLILEIHGGPHSQYGQAFFHEFQVLAGRGYFVFYTNPRGSKGYGEMFTGAIRGHWGERDYQDLMKGMDDLLATRPYIDTTRLGVTGGSYGGFMTNWIVGHTGRFRAAVTQRSVVNLHSMAGTCDFPLLQDKEYFDANAWDAPGEFLRQSPLTYAAHIRTPLLILHSEGDLRCPIEQAEQLFTALSVLKREVTFVRYPREANHGLSRSGPPDLRLDRLERIVGWMEQYLKS